MKKSLAILFLLLLAAAPAPSEVSVTRAGDVWIVAEEGRIWQPVRKEVAPRYFLNPWGDRRGDLAPSLSVSPIDGAPEAVYAKQLGDYELVLARWNGERWIESRLTENEQNDLLPILRHDEWGNRFIVWTSYEPGGSSVRLMALPAGDSLPAPQVSHPLGDAEGRGLDAALDSAGDLLVLSARRRQGRSELVLVQFSIDRDSRGSLLEGGPRDPLASAALTLERPDAVQLGRRVGSRVQQRSPRRGQLDTAAGRETAPLSGRIHVEEGSVWISWVPMVLLGGGGEVLPEPLALRYAVYQIGTFSETGSVELGGLDEHSIRQAEAEVRRRVLTGSR